MITIFGYISLLTVSPTLLYNILNKKGKRGDKILPIIFNSIVLIYIIANLWLGY